MSFSHIVVLDIETTGFGRNHRIVEIACNGYTHSGDYLFRFETLLDPERDIPNSCIHGIEPHLLRGAPRLVDIGDCVAALLDNALIVAHNAAFDINFVINELSSCGIDMDVPGSECTMQLLRSQTGLQRLEQACSHFGIDSGHAHSAAHDVLATAELYFNYLKPASNDLQVPGSDQRVESDFDVSSVRTLTREQAIETWTKSQILEPLLHELPTCSDCTTEGRTEYFDHLCLFMEDRELTEPEAKILLKIAQQNSLSRTDVDEIHVQYLSDIAADYRSIGQLAEPHFNDLQIIATQLGISSHEQFSAVDAKPWSHAGNLEGKTIQFTGTFPFAVDGTLHPERVKKHKQDAAKSNGMTYAKSVTKSLDFLVIALPFSRSSKSEKARRYGTRILSEMEFWRIMRKQVSSPAPSNQAAA